MSGREARWREVSELLNEALDLPPGDRRAFVHRACGDDEELCRRVLELLAAAEDAADFLVRPVFSLRRTDEEEPNLELRIGPYRLVRSLGHGGIGEVYLGERIDGEFDQQVAIKLLKRGMDTEEIVRRFEAERQILADLAHPNVARLLDGGTTGDGLPYFVMEYVQGEPIDEYCDARRLTVKERVRLVREVCDAVHFAHRNLVVHRDLKPANILVTPQGVPKLLDFGIAKLLSGDPRFLATAAGSTAPMTPRYASPEQVRGGPVTTATDVYALGVLLYELLTGGSPYTTDPGSLESLHQAICEQTPRKPSTAVRGDREARRLAGDLDIIVMKALRKKPERRFSSVEQFSEDLRRYLEGLPIRSRPDTLSYRAGKFVRRHAWGVTAAAVIAALILGFAITMTVQRSRIARKNVEIGPVRGR